MTAMVHANNAYSLRTQLAIARWGKGARYPLCQAGLSLWSVEKELRKIGNDIALLDGDPSSSELRKCKEQYWLLIYYNLYTVTLARFEIELDAANIKTFRAYKRLKKRWGNGSGEAHLTDRQKRVIGILELLRDKVIKAARAKGGAKAGYIEAAFGGDRPLSDEVWQERLTGSEIHSHLVAIEVFSGNGSKARELHDIRRDVGRLAFRLAEAQRGRKHKPPYLLKPQKKPPPTGQPVGRPETNLVKYSVANPDVPQGIEFQKQLGRRPKTERRFFWRGFWSEREELKSRIINKVQFYLCPRGMDWRTFRSQHAPGPELLGRSPVFKAWMDSLAAVRYPRWMVLRMVELERYCLKRSLPSSHTYGDENLEGVATWEACIKLRGPLQRVAEQEAAKDAEQRDKWLEKP